MARALNPRSAMSQAHLYFTDFLEQRVEVEQWDQWGRGEQERSLYVPKHYNTNDEYQDLVERSPTPWLSLIVTSVAQTAYTEGVRRSGSTDNMEVWETWQQNRWDSRQGPLYRSVLTHGIAYASALPGILPLTGEKSAVMRGYSALTTAAWYAEVDDEWPMFAIHALPDTDVNGQPGWAVELIDEVAVYRMRCAGDGENIEDWEFYSTETHDLGVTPIVKYTNLVDLDGRYTGEVEPFVPLAKRIDQDTFDRLIVQRFGAWKIRWITGLQRPAGVSESKYQTELMKMKINDFLISTSDKTKFGTLDETQLDGFIKARDADLRDLSAVTQTPPHHLLGLTANMQAESLAAARAGLAAKSQERRTGWGESHEQLLRLTAKIRGNREEMRAWDMQVRWRDMEVRSLSQAADALGKLAAQVGVPPEMLWERIPGWTDSDTERAKKLVAQGAFDQLVREFEGQMQQTGQASQTAPVKREVP